MNKETLFLSLFLTILLLGGCIANLPILMLAVVGVVCVSILLSKLTEATCLLFYFSPFSYILVYNQFNVYILIIVTYIIAVLLKRKNPMGVLTSVFLMVFCICFASTDTSLNIGRFIHPILLMLLIFVCQFTPKKDYKSIVIYFMIGFVVSAIIGFFKDKMPLIQNVLTSDMLYIAGVETSMSIIRYSGLSYDPNFFALIDCILISLILFSEKHINLIKVITLLFLLIVGFFTFSKSYVILLAIIGVTYVLKNSKRPLRTFSFVLVAYVSLLMIEKYSDLKVLSLIEARFSSADGVKDLTTGRLDLWIKYLDYIFNNVKCLFLGEGFNALSLGKAVHNTYIDFIYRFGLLGTGLWIGYFVWCKKFVDRVGGPQKYFNVAGVVFFFGIFFLSAFHFQQFWCCIFLVMIAPYLNGGENEKIECDSSNIQR